MKAPVNCLGSVTLIVFVILAVHLQKASAQNQVVVIPLSSAVSPPAPVAKTGQKKSFLTRDDGALEKGVVSPSPRFVNNNNGTVTDRLTNLIWLTNGSCAMFHPFDPNGGKVARTWSAAIDASNKLGNGYCGLTDNSQPGDWRLPNIREMQSLVDFGQWYPSMSIDSPLRDSIQLDSSYWSSTSYASENSTVWCVHYWSGKTENRVDWEEHYIRAVRDEQ